MVRYGEEPRGTINLSAREEVASTIAKITGNLDKASRRTNNT